MIDFTGLSQQVDSIDDTQLVALIQKLRSMRGLVGPAIKLFARQYGAEEWAEFILSDDVSEEQLVALFTIVKREKANGAEAVREALRTDPITGPLFTEANVRIGR